MRRRSGRGQGGQAIVEYAGVLALVAFLIGFAFAISQGSLFAGISNTYSQVSSTINHQNLAALNH